METRIHNNLVVTGSFSMAENLTAFPDNPAIGTFVVKDQCLYGYIKIGGMETWYPFASKTNSYIHTQGLDSLEWNVTHNLGTTNVWTQVKDVNGSIVQPLITAIDVNTIRVKFTVAGRGTVVVVAPDTIDVPLLKASALNVANDVIIMDSSGIRINGSYALTAANITTEINSVVTAHENKADPHTQYNHPASHPPSIIVQNSTNRFVTDAEKTAWGAKQSALGFTPEDSASKGIANGYAGLDASGKVPSTQLPSYVDDVLEFDTLSVFPDPGETGKIYADLSTDKQYRWSGSVYAKISSGAVDSVAGKTGIITLVKADVGLSNVDNTTDANKPVSGATQTALDAKLALAGGILTGDLAITKANAAIELGLINGTASTPMIDFHSGTTAIDYDVRMQVSGGTGVVGKGTLNVTANSTVFSGTLSGTEVTATSDARKKTNVETFKSALDTVTQLRGVTFDWIDSGIASVGVIAQEVERVVPSVVFTDEEGGKTVAYGNIVGILIEATKEQQSIVVKLEERIRSLESK